jgi:hypothetical protein
MTNLAAKLALTPCDTVCKKPAVPGMRGASTETRTKERQRTREPQQRTKRTERSSSASLLLAGARKAARRCHANAGGADLAAKFQQMKKGRAGCAGRGSPIDDGVRQRAGNAPDSRRQFSR